MRLRHCIITRFNINIERTDFGPRLENPWLSLRFDLFQRFCFPSVRGQSCQDFTWLVLFDAKTPQRYRKLISAYASHPTFRPVFCGAYDTVLHQVLDVLRGEMGDAEWLLTTRLDNDDALGVRFVDALHQVARTYLRESRGQGDRVFFNFTNGLQVHDNELYLFRDPTNAFVSLLEPIEDAKTVFWVDHPAIASKARVVQVDAPPLWLQNVHGTNVYNYVRGERIASIATLSDLDGFTL